MCGIAGIMTTDGTAPDQSTLDILQAALRHRGPDGAGQHLGEGVGLVHTRLAIIDLKTGDQPFQSPDGTALIANAEIYNYLELRETLVAGPQDIQLKTQSDCEPALYLYCRDGVDFANQMRGMYAIAIHDPNEGQLILARDPFGIKPLYYVEGPFGFAFASEPAALLKAGLVGPGVAEQPLHELLQIQFTTGRHTIHPDIHRVLPGETLVIAQGRIVDRRRRSALPLTPPREQTETAALAELEQVLMDSVEIHQRSDVPYGMFLSGGIDSSALLTLMTRLNDQPVHAFTAGFSGTKVHDERDQARALARQLGAEHYEIDFVESDFWALLPEVAAVLDDPAADYATLPTYKLAAKAKAAGMKVVLSGEGGDELFAGYGRYKDAQRSWWVGGPRIMRRTGRFDRLGILRQPSDTWRDGIRAAESTLGAADLSRLQLAQAIDCADWLPNDLLIKLDRCLMAHGVEGRTPFLDPVVANFAYRLPDDLKLQNGKGKYLLRRWLATASPMARPFDRKFGFTVPVAEWIRSRGEKLGPLVAAQPGVHAIAHPDRVTALYQSSGKRQGFAAWTLLFYALWHRHHVLGAAPQGDVFETLSTSA
ncbi:MAG: asparagine synthase (glutamine-hydrolyzing) [Rhodospirillaceae bacterium]|jgi:asparagine synthase (glutamine-hydrolysing)|nr:asparagine synthase (glutamine-hydrolyzing) [Rhodospirillaceae bacterium]MBT5081831.1 asparagine synthase (glutamine-hydrolyzing) [Rhodospirillaceae bacterium]MBT5524931.1 asparagine synthase (glutamine-hydrolyzing) [Rhodospirillaceae bacterium]MBT5881396.1 asparagine synthase (glutamine-hydrolyzing) [Rhodospirillaceae bacterium]MBT7286658.1 asparagine synthase (glutamine-hydrolyzing) [Rhodospirillaceae bacterium]